MTGRVKSGPTRIEVEIEKNREESNWIKVIELAEQLKEKSPESVITEAGIKAGVAMDAHLLLGKLQYACGLYSEALKHFKLADLQNLSEKKLPLRSLRIVAESYAIKGLCLQKEGAATSKFKKAEKEEELAKCFDLASDLSLLYMQKLEKELSSNAPVVYNTTGSHSPQPPIVQKALGEVLEQALQTSPAIFLQHNKPEKALERYRNSLCAIESQGLHSIRLKFMCQMAELLLQGLVGEKYKPPLNSTPKSSVWKPKYYASLNQFIPRNECEETILLLLVAESMAVRNAVLSQSPEFKDIRLSAYQDATTVYDLLTVATVRWGQIALLQESLERSMKFSFEEPHLWKQHALSLISINKYDHALSVLKEVIRLEPDNPSNCLLAAKLCYEHLNLAKEETHPDLPPLNQGTIRKIEAQYREMGHVRKVPSKRQAVVDDDTKLNLLLALEENPITPARTKFSMEAREKALTSSALLGRSHLYIGIGYHLQAEACQLKKEKEELRCRALDNFRSAVELEPNDHMCRYYLSLTLAIMGHITEAQQHIKIGLNLHPEHSSILHLLVLLLTAERQHKYALAVVENALEEYPDCLNLMYVKAYLELHERGGEHVLITAKQMLELWKNLYEGQTVSDMPECDRKSDTRSVFQLYTSEMSDKDSSSLQLHNTAASRVEQALSEVASSMSSFNPRPGPQRAWMLQVEIWLLLAEIYLALDQPSDVQMCIQEATQIYPLSHHIMHMKGLYHMHKQEWPEAKLCFQNAVAINPQHVKSLQQLGLVYHYLGLQGLAETTLREAAKIEPKNHITWYNLGKVLEALGEYEKASNAMATALMEEKNNPILPFNSVPLCFE
ncbi:hypothetical protein NQ318_020949 [Aromia moschata]|uniref:Tetratricopeptide repeat protein 7 N-terminal domain-containing protein n=1 Tax=Aromia moschata TaxID=1265417 RepID=A0AAV8YPH2_9CUCU|nr:hypothetical protein NQ318_020949 [Aromia moschata]